MLILKAGTHGSFYTRCLLPTWNLTIPRERWPLLVHIYNSILVAINVFK